MEIEDEVRAVVNAALDLALARREAFGVGMPRTEVRCGAWRARVFGKGDDSTLEIRVDYYPESGWVEDDY